MASETQVKHWVTLTSGWDGMPIAYHLQEEGNKSVVGQVQSKKELDVGDDKESPDDREARLLQYEGMLDKHKARVLVEALKKMENKDEYFIFCDQNNLFKYAEELLEAGFTKGLFPTKEDFEFEKNREDAMSFVEQYYPDVKIIPHDKYATVEEAREAVNESDVPLVIQSEGDFVPTICPGDDVEQNHTEILAALDKYEKDYSKGQIILKEKLIQPVEITPQIVFWNGEPVFTDLDIETKNIGDGENNGNQVGCGSNLIVRTELDDLINQVAFPPKVFEMAKQHTGLFVWDISLYLTPEGIFFGEFCSNRFGYDALMTEMTMSHGPAEYFTRIMRGENPLDFPFGTAVRVFNLNKAGEQEINIGSPKPTWLYEVTAKDDKLLTIEGGWDLGVITGRGMTVEEAIDDVYENIGTLTCKEKYARTKADFLMDYPTSIVNRYDAVNGILFNATPMKPSPQAELDAFKGKTKEALFELASHDNAKSKEKLLELFPEEKVKLLDEKAEELFPLLLPYFDKIYDGFQSQMDTLTASVEDVALSGNSRIEDAITKVGELNTVLDSFKALLEEVKTAVGTGDATLQSGFEASLKELSRKQSALLQDEQKQRGELSRKFSSEIGSANRTFSQFRDEYGKYTKTTAKSLEDIRAQLKKEVAEIFNKMSALGGGGMNRNIAIGGNASALSRYTDINFKAGSNVTITYVNNNTTKALDITFASSGGGGSVVGTTRSINNISTSQSAGSSSDYVYICSAGIRVTLPDPTSNTNLYTIKNTSASSVLISPFGAETIDGSSNLILPVQFTAVDLISDGTNWEIT